MVEKCSIQRSKYGMTASTRVCWSMISETQTAYGFKEPRQGNFRPWRVYQFRICSENAVISVYYLSAVISVYSGRDTC